MDFKLYDSLLLAHYNVSTDTAITAEEIIALLEPKITEITTLVFTGAKKEIAEAFKEKIDQHFANKTKPKIFHTALAEGLSTIQDEINNLDSARLIQLLIKQKEILEYQQEIEKLLTKLNNLFKKDPNTAEHSANSFAEAKKILNDIQENLLSLNHLKKLIAPNAASAKDAAPTIDMEISDEVSAFMQELFAKLKTGGFIS
jgi:hypothetical protein